MKMAVKTVEKSLLTWAVVALTIIAVSCSKQADKQRADAGGKYDGWQTYTYENVKLIHPPDYALQDSLPHMAADYAAGLARDCRFFKMDVPKETLVVYLYTGYRHGRETTGREYPFADSAAIHFWLPSFPGTTLMQWLLPRWQNVQPKHEFLRHGLISLLDYSGQNYHLTTKMYLDSNQFIPLAELATDTTIDSDTERYQSAEAASFVDFVSYYFDVVGLELLYRTPASFERAVDGIFMMSVDSLQALWLDFVDKHVAAADTTSQNK